jgi:hypothetical protein
MTRSEGGAGIVFQAYYRAGNPTDSCGQLYGGSGTGDTMSQYGSQNCDAAYGDQWPSIVRAYYFSPVVSLLDDNPATTEYFQPGDTWHLNVYATSRTGDVYEKFATATSGLTWYGWNWLASPSGGCTSSEGTASGDAYNLWMFCRGVDGAIWGRRWNGSSWLAWQSLGGTFQSGPAVTEYIQSPWILSHINVEALGWDGAVWHNYYDENNSTWSGWTSLGAPSGGCTSAPSTDYRVSNELYALCRGADGNVWYRLWNGSAWLGWAVLNAGLGPDGSIGSTHYNQPGDTWHFNVYMDSHVGALWESWKGSGGFSSWGSRGGRCESGGAAASFSPNDLRLFCRLNDSNIWYDVWNGGGWSGFVYYIGRP